MNSSELNSIERSLTVKLKSIQDEVLYIFFDYIDHYLYRRTKSLQGLHALIGGKNNIFADCIRMQFMSPKEFLTQWIKGLVDEYGEKKYLDDKGNSYNYLLIDLLKNDKFRDYTFTFLERNFYRNLVARIREKPDETLWDIWFGSGNFILGILITPVMRSNKWTNDVSEIRRTKYRYWTVGHIMETGFIDPDANEKIGFDDHNDLFVFYRSIIKKLSNSPYEKGIIDRYIDYLKNSSDINEEPLLIPEIRYAGLEKNHKYRLDFTILNYHTQEYIGFELSPSSSHMSISGIKTKTQIKINEELSDKWSKEMSKRNEYFKQFGIKTLTFTDKDLPDLDMVFKEISKYLSSRKESHSLEDELGRLFRCG
ncbi:MAG: hypothetical protein PHC69_05285 [Ruminiclostridium sp.]|nr:hypothetical protein [Ruminiclostridium sp.]